ncbi:MAG: hypothetical protein NTW87_34470, partial [Planctomycetota bacterium]|nr:hypothetical protein [Planctomycetota bacterium]
GWQDLIAVIPAQAGIQNKTAWTPASAGVTDAARTETLLNRLVALNAERSRDLPKNVRHGILTGMQQKAPAGYQDLLEAYYKSLVEEKDE